MSGNQINEEYCPKCSSTLRLMGRRKDGENMMETYYCGPCSQEYEYQYEFKDIIKQ